MTLPSPARIVTRPGTAVTVSPLAGGAAGLTLGTVSQPAHGSLERRADSSLLYTPAAGFVGEDSFTCVLNDVGGGASELLVTLLVDTAPVARPDKTGTDAGAAVILDPLANDGDPDGDRITLAGLAQPAHGSLAVLPDGTLRYEPQSGFTGRDEFAYDISDPAGLVSTAAIEVVVSPAAKRLTSRKQRRETKAGTPFTVDPKDGVAESPADVALAGLGLPAHGTLAVNADRTVTYAPKLGFTGEDSFSLEVRDNGGTSATNNVTVAVLAVNTAPAARNDAVATTTGMPVAFDPLANDTDAEGDALSIVGLSMPAHGRLALGLDRKLTYTPDAGFTGKDAFSYIVSDPSGATATATVDVTVTAPAVVPTFANGYRSRRRLVLVERGGASGVTAQDFVLFVDEQADWLKGAGQGGAVQSGDGFDLRFELADGTRLMHELDRYDPATGRLTAWVRLPSWTLSKRQTLYLYAGKPGLAQSEANPAGAWGAVLASIDPTNGADRSGHGHDLAAASITPAELVGDAARLDGSASVLSGGAASWLDGLAGFSFACWAQSEVLDSSRGLALAGAPAAGETAAGLVIRHAATGSNGTTRLWSVKARFTDQANAKLEAAAGGADKASHHILAGWRKGEGLRFYLDGGEAAAVARTGTAIQGPSAFNTGPFALGTAAGTAAGSRWQGLIGRVVIRAQLPDPAQIAAEYANQAAPRRFYGLGDTDGPADSLTSAVAMPASVTVRSGSYIDIDVVALAEGAPAAGGTAIASFDQPLRGQVSVVGGKLRYAAPLGYVGADSFAYTLGLGGKTSTARITVDVAQGQSDGLPAPKRTVSVTTAAELTAALAAAQAGDHITLANGTYAGSFKLKSGGNATYPIVVRAGTKLGAKLTGSLQLAGAYGIVWGLEIVGGSMTVTGDNSRVTRCRLRDNPDVALGVLGGRNVEIDHNEFTGCKGRGLSIGPDPDNPAALTKPWVHHNWFHDYSGEQGDNVHEGMQVGMTWSHSDIAVGAIVEYNLFERVSVDPECISVKSSENVIRFNTLIDCVADISNRHGERNQYIGNWMERSRGMMVMDEDTTLIGNRLTDSGGFGVRVMAGTVDPDSKVSGYPYANNTKLIGNVFDKLVIGSNFSSGTPLPATNTRVEAHNGMITKGNETRTAIVATTATAVTSAVKTSGSQVGPNGP